MKIVSGNIEAPNGIAIVGAGISIAVNELMYRYQNCVGTENNSPAIIANAWDNRSDAMSSIGVLIGIIFRVLGFPIADVLAAVVVALIVAKIGIELNVSAIDGLMDSSVEMDVLKVVYDIAIDTPKVEASSFFAGATSAKTCISDLRVLVKGKMKVSETDQIIKTIKDRILAEVEHVRDLQIAVSPDSA